MGRCKKRAFRLLQSIQVPLLGGKFQIRIHRLFAVVDQFPPINSNDSQISDITSPVQNCLELVDQTFSCVIVHIFAEKILLHILVAGDHISNIFHVVNIRIYILIHLLHDILGVDRGIFKNRIAGISHRNTGYNQHRT